MTEDIKALQYVIMEKNRIISDCNDSFREYNERLENLKSKNRELRWLIDHSQVEAYDELVIKNSALKRKCNDLEYDNKHLQEKCNGLWHRMVQRVDVDFVIIGGFILIGMIIGSIIGLLL